MQIIFKPKNFLCILILFLFLGACSDIGRNRLNIATASSSHRAIKDIAYVFQEKYNIKINIISSSSGKLCAQIKQGAPYDIFISADILYPQELYETGYTSEAPLVYAYGKLVCWTTKAQIKPEISSFTNPLIKKIAIPNPKLAPYGRLSISAIEHFGILDSVKHKFVFGENVSQTSQFILSGAADIGITSISMVKSLKRAKEKWKELPAESYIPIAQSTVIINRSNHEYTRKFYDFLFSEEAAIVFESYGFTVDLSK